MENPFCLNLLQGSVPASGLGSLAPTRPPGCSNNFWGQSLDFFAIFNTWLLIPWSYPLSPFSWHLSSLFSSNLWLPLSVFSAPQVSTLWPGLGWHHWNQRLPQQTTHSDDLQLSVSPSKPVLLSLNSYLPPVPDHVRHFSKSPLWDRDFFFI